MNILITGASGFLATELIKQLQQTNYNLFALSSQKDTVESKYKNTVQVYNNQDIETGNLPWEEIDIVIHCAFTRSNSGIDLAKSLDFSKIVFLEAFENNCKLINISSRSVYGQNPNIPWNEYSFIDLDSTYAMAKYSSELLLEAIYKSKKEKIFTNIRLAGLISPNFNDRIVNKFIQIVLEQKSINITGGEQQFAFLDLRDAASAIISMFSVNRWEKVYNLGSESSLTIVDLAEKVKKIGNEYISNDIKINLIKSDITFFSEMDSTLFYRDFSWKPKYNIEKTIRNIFDYKLNLY